MKKIKKKLSVIISLIMTILIVCTNISLAVIKEANLEIIEYSQEYQDYLLLSEGEKENILPPRMYDEGETNIETDNPLKLGLMVGNSNSATFDLRNYISNNLVVRNQGELPLCWAFAYLGALESTLGYKNYLSSGSQGEAFDFSEAHMDYMTSSNGTNPDNEKGYNKSVGSPGNFLMANTYTLNGFGPVKENDFPYNTSLPTVNLSKVTDLAPTVEVLDTVDFAKPTTTVEKENLKKEMKKAISTYGGVYAIIHGDGNIWTSGCYNQSTGAHYCNKEACQVNHAILIIGWDDNYSASNFNQTQRPNSNGAWIVKNSWGTVLGKSGFMYLSYDDINVYNEVHAIEKASKGINYNNIYYYDEYGPTGAMSLALSGNTMYIGNKFDKKTSGNEYVSKVGIYTPEEYTCKVWINPNNDDLNKNNMQAVELAAGQTETFGAGFHTIEFKEPVKIKGSKFAVIVEVTGANKVSVENEVIISSIFNRIQKSGKCFVSDNGKDWLDLNRDSTLRVYSINAGKELASIKVTKAPNKVNYKIGENFNSDGMKVFAVYDDNSEAEITTYTITDGNNLQLGTTEVTISYNGKTAKQPITVADKLQTGIEIQNPPTKTEYYEGENFDKTGMKVNLLYDNTTKQEITNYEIVSGNNLNKNQTEITIKYNNFTAKQAITVKEDALKEIKITKAPNRIVYREGDSFDKTGMVITAVYNSGRLQAITEYTLEDDKNLTLNQTAVKIKYNGLEVSQNITVKTGEITGIVKVQNPRKTTYFEGEDFDKENLVIAIKYSDGDQVQISNYTLENDKDLKLEQTSVTAKYETYTLLIPITVKKVEVSSIALETGFSENKYNLNSEIDLSKIKIKVTYNNGKTEIISANSEGVEVTGVDTTSEGRKDIKIKYAEKEIGTSIQVEDLSKYKNSTFENGKIEDVKVDVYTFTDPSKKPYEKLDITIKDIKINEYNKDYKYYYYISNSSNEDNISNWIEIKEKEITNNSLRFIINTKDNDLGKLVSENKLYVYIKEVIPEGLVGAEVAAQSKAMEVSIKNVKINTYVDNVLKSETTEKEGQIETVDKTTAPGKLPQTGEKIILFVAIAGIVLVVIRYKKYRKLKEVK